MGVFKIFPSQDATIYSDFQFTNAGLDAILDLSKKPPYLFPYSSSVSRVLLKFDNDDINEAVSKSGANFTASLKIYNSTVESIPTNFNIELHPLYESWDMGTGRFNDIPTIKDGASWVYRSANQTNAWITNSYPTGVTGSYHTGSIGGGSWYTASITQSFNYFSTKDINLNITRFVGWITSSVITNNGFIIMNSTASNFEFDGDYNYTFNFYSRDTNTIYPPYLEFKWDDSTINPGATPYITTEELNISVANNKNIFNDGEYVKFRVYAREKYPQQNYTLLTSYLYKKL